MEHHDILIVGGGHAGAQCAIALRHRGFAGSLAIIGEEPDLPYERPPLSKEYLAGSKPFERLLIRPPAFWADREVAMLTGQTVTALDPQAHQVMTAAGVPIGYGRLVWAAGGHARGLTCDGGDLTGVHSVRTRADVDRLAQELAAVRRVAVVGGGYIGLEAAAVMRGLGREVVLFEAAPHLLSRVAGRALSDFLAAEHRRRGVDVRLGTTIADIVGADGRVAGVRLRDGGLVDADMVIVGIGIVPAVEPLLAAGARGGNGVAVDRHCGTTLADVYAIGDCALQANPFADDLPVRIESVGNANDMAAVAASALTGSAAPQPAPPWFWSNQYDLKLQSVGLAAGHDSEVVRGDPATGSFSVLYRKSGRVVALDCVNAVKDYVGGRVLVAAGAVVAPERLADTAIPLKTMID